MIISKLIPAAIVGEEAYVAMNRASNPRLFVMSRSTLGRAIFGRLKCHQESVREDLRSVDVCHVKLGMWTSAANEAFGSFVASRLEDDWELQTRVLRCCVVKGRHTEISIASFLLQVSGDFGLTKKIGLVRTYGARDFVAAGGVLGDVEKILFDAAQAGELRKGRDRPTDDNGMVYGHATAVLLAIAGDRSEPCGAETDEDEGGDGADLPDVASDCGDGAEVDHQTPPAGGTDA